MSAAATNATTETACRAEHERCPADRLDEHHRDDGSNQHARVEEQAHHAIDPAEHLGRDALLERRLTACLVERRGRGADDQQAERRDQSADHSEKPDGCDLEQEADRDAPGADGARDPAQEQDASGDPTGADGRVEPPNIGGLPEAIGRGNDQYRLERGDGGRAAEERGGQGPQHRIAGHDGGGAGSIARPPGSRATGPTRSESTRMPATPNDAASAATRSCGRTKGRTTAPMTGATSTLDSNSPL